MKSKNYTTIEEDFLSLQQKCKDKPLSIREILDTLTDKWESLTLLFLSLPFCQPLQIPGLSTPFGIVIAYIGFKMAFGNYAWLPERILAQNIPSHTLNKILEKILWIVKKMKRWVHPRLGWLCHSRVMQIINGLFISSLGIFLALPLPIPFSNLIAAWSIFLIGLGKLESDGFFILLGYLVSICSLIFLLATIIFIQKYAYQFAI